MERVHESLLASGKATMLQVRLSPGALHKVHSWSILTQIEKPSEDIGPPLRGCVIAFAFLPHKAAKSALSLSSDNWLQYQDAIQ
jgi:hypothetical protein